MIKNPIIGIIGGSGLMGSLFKSFFEKQNLKVQIASRRTKLSIEECAKKSDIVIVSVPINVTDEIIKKVAPLVKKDGLLMDITSLKSEPLKVMLEHSNCSVLGTHPVFGPGVENIKNQTIVLCPGRGQEWMDWVENIYRQGQAKIKICSAQEHDKMMAIIQVLVHFSTISVAHVLKELKIDIFDSLDFSSPIYKLRMDMIGRILNQDPRLYADIEILNPESVGVLDSYLKSSNELFNTIKNKDVDAFIEYFNSAADYLGDFKNEATEYSNFVIKNLVNNKPSDK